MPVELRKRKAPPPAPEPPKKKAAKANKPAPKAKDAIKPKKDGEPAPAAKTNGAAASKKVAVGDSVDLATFGGTVTLNDGTETTLAELVGKSGAGVVLFTYPKASTPGCTTQACLFRDAYEPLTKGGLAIYGLSRDSPKSNTTFQEKQKLPYPLICDPKAGLISAIGLSKAPSSTQRGVFVVDKEGKVLLAEPGSPAGTVSAVKKLVESKGTNGAAAAATAAAGEKKKVEEKEEKEEAEAEAKEEDEEEKPNGAATEEDKEVQQAEAEGK